MSVAERIQGSFELLSLVSNLGGPKLRSYLSYCILYTLGDMVFHYAKGFV